MERFDKDYYWEMQEDLTKKLKSEYDKMVKRKKSFDFLFYHYGIPHDKYESGTEITEELGGDLPQDLLLVNYQNDYGDNEKLYVLEVSEKGITALSYSDDDTIEYDVKFLFITRTYEKIYLLGEMQEMLD